MALTHSARSRAIEPFHVMALLARANELQAAGHDVIHLEIGEPDFTTAAPIVAAGQAALAAGHTRYTAARGLPELREAIAGFLPPALWRHGRPGAHPDHARRFGRAAAGQQPVGGPGQALVVG